MNSKEAELFISIKEYTKNLRDYSSILLNVIDNIERLQQLEEKININKKSIEKLESKVRPLTFLQDLEKLPETLETIMEMVKKYTSKDEK